MLGLTALLAIQGEMPSSALDSKRTLSQYVHTVWDADKGYNGGVVYAIAQSADGYLWLGTEHGLVRFDGSEFTLLRTPLAGQKPTGAVRGLVEDAEGSLWIRLDGPRLLRYRDGVFEDAASRFALFDSLFTTISKDSAGNLLLWGFQKGLLRFRAQRFEQMLPRDNIAGVIYSLYESPGGALWLGARDSGLFQLENGQSTQVLPESALRGVNALAPSEQGGIWIGSEAGLRLWEHGALVQLTLPAQLRESQVFALVRDHDHNLWAGTDTGLYRIDPERKVVTGYYRNPHDTRVVSLYEDGDGNLWYAGAHSLERLRDGMLTSFSPQETALRKIGGPLFNDDAGRTWFAPVSGGLFCLENGAVRRVAVPGLGNDVIYSIDGGGDELWLGRQQGGLTELTRHGNQWSTRTFTQKGGLSQDSVYTVTRARDGTVWAGTVSGGINVLRHGKVTRYTVNDGLPSNAVFSSLEAGDGKMWFASPGGLICFDGEHWQTYNTAEDAPPVNVRTVFQDAGGVLWVGTSRGLARFDGHRIEVLHALPQALAEEILSIGQDAQGFLWIATDQHILQIDRTKLLAGTLENEDVLSYGAEDGLIETEGVRRHRSLVSDSSGRIWLSLPHSLAVADVQRAAGYRQPVRVRIDAAFPGSTAVLSSNNFNLSSNTRSITFRYAGTNTVTPQRIQFRYRLDGLDQTWSSGGSSRQVVYSHLAPGRYTFRMMASNALGAWNGPENDIMFYVQPAWWQTWFVRVLGTFDVAVLVLLLYRFRLMQVTNRLNKRFRDRLAERARIAQDLHDTLLQGVISAAMQLDVAQDHVSEDSPARPMMGRALQLMRQVTNEGREALRGLRTIDNSVSLETALERLLNESEPPPSSERRVRVEGNTRLLNTAVFDEAYRIGREAWINAVAHAEAARTEITIEYGRRGLRLTVSDNGRGIEPDMLKAGREGHFGLAGMKERAESIGSVLTICSRMQAGTEIELRVPAAIAYPRTEPGKFHWPWWIRKHDANSEEGRQQPR